MDDQPLEFILCTEQRSSGVSSVEMVFVQAESWLIKLKKDRRSVQLASVGNFEMASVVVLYTW